MDTLELITRLGRRRGFDGGPARLRSFVNDAYQEMCGIRLWSWLLRHVQFQVFAPDSGTAGTVVLNSNVVQGLTAGASKTRTGAMLALPDGNTYRIQAGWNNYLQAYLETLYLGATVNGTAAWKAYYDEYPLPAGAQALQSVALTGQGYTAPLHPLGKQQIDMHQRARKDYESVPLAYSLERHSQLPTPRTAVAVAGTATVGLPDGVYTYWYAFLNTRTGEVGPLSPASSTVTVAARTVTVSSIPTLWDYGRRLFRSFAGKTEPYFLADIGPTGASYADNTGDVSLGMDATTQTLFGRYTQSHGAYHIRLWPPPDKAYLLDAAYYTAVRELVDDHEIPLVPVQWHHVLLTLAEAYALGDEENHGAATSKRQIAAGQIERMEEEEDPVPETTLIVGGVEGGMRTPGQQTWEPDAGKWPRVLG
mgnify:CR=1 FL=1